jgi:pimeloyl-ACP methyl ester carboxylesterase
MAAGKLHVVCIPGGVAPAAQRYAPLVETVGEAADLHLKDLEVYRDASPPPDYSIEHEVEAIDRFADSRHLDDFHLVAYSAGGFMSLAYAATRPERVISLAVFEAARIPGPLTDREAAFFTKLRQTLRGLEGADYLATFVREQVKPGVALAPPPSGPPSPEMQKRPAGLAALDRAFDAYPFDRELLRTDRFPVFYAYGDRSHEEQAWKAGILAELFADIRVRRFAGVHHFVPSEQIYTPAYAEMLLGHWRRAEALETQLSRE